MSILPFLPKNELYEIGYQIYKAQANLMLFIQKKRSSFMNTMQLIPHKIKKVISQSKLIIIIKKTLAVETAQSGMSFSVVKWFLLKNNKIASANRPSTTPVFWADFSFAALRSFRSLTFLEFDLLFFDSILYFQRPQFGNGIKRTFHIDKPNK